MHFPCSWKLSANIINHLCLINFCLLYCPVINRPLEDTLYHIQNNRRTWLNNNYATGTKRIQSY